MSADAVRWVWEHSPLKGSELLVHVAIADTVNAKHGNEFWGSLAGVARKTRLNRDTVRAAVRKLEQHGLLHRIGTEPGASVRYLFVMEHPAGETYPAGEPRGTETEADPAEIEANPAAHPRGPRGTAAPNTSERDEPNGTQTLGFAEFWTLYPRKVKKPKALTAWNTATKHTAAGVIVSGLERWVQHWQADATEERFIPHPATWLNGHQWNDATPAVRVRAVTRNERNSDAVSRVASYFTEPALREVSA